MAVIVCGTAAHVKRWGGLFSRTHPGHRRLVGLPFARERRQPLAPASQPPCTLAPQRRARYRRLPPRRRTGVPSSRPRHRPRRPVILAAMSAAREGVAPPGPPHWCAATGLPGGPSTLPATRRPGCGRRTAAAIGARVTTCLGVIAATAVPDDVFRPAGDAIPGIRAPHSRAHAPPAALIHLEVFLQDKVP